MSEVGLLDMHYYGGNVLSQEKIGLCMSVNISLICSSCLLGLYTQRRRCPSFSAFSIRVV